MNEKRMLPEGKHRAVAVDAMIGTTEGWTEQVAIRFQLLDEPDGFTTATWYGTFASDAATEFTVKAMRVAGFGGNDLTDLSSLKRDDTPEVVVVVEHETYKGVTRAKVKYVNAAAGPMMKNALTGKGAEDFAAKMRARFAAFDQREGRVQAPAVPRGKPRAAPTRNEPPPPSDDDAQAPWESSDDSPF